MANIKMIKFLSKIKNEKNRNKNNISKEEYED